MFLRGVRGREQSRMVPKRLGGPFSRMEKACVWEGGRKRVGGRRLESQGNMKMSTGNTRRQLSQVRALG